MKIWRVDVSLIYDANRKPAKITGGLTSTMIRLNYLNYQTSSTSDATMAKRGFKVRVNLTRIGSYTSLEKAQGML